MSYPILYSFRRCPYAMRARLALYHAKIPHEHREVDLKNKPAEMLKISPKGTVPVLQLPDETVLEQSLDIMAWAFGNFVPSPEDKNLIAENDTTFKQALDRYKYPGRYPEDEQMNYRGNCEAFLKKIEARLDPFLTGNAESYVGMAIFPFIRQFSLVDPDWFGDQPYPRIIAWLHYFNSSDLFNEIMKNYEPWAPGPKPLIISF